MYICMSVSTRHFDQFDDPSGLFLQIDHYVSIRVMKKNRVLDKNIISHVRWAIKLCRFLKILIH